MPSHDVALSAWSRLWDTSEAKSEKRNPKSETNSNDPNSNDPNKNGPWSDFDPFIYLPLLPYFVNQVPKVGEKVMLFYYNTKIKR